jgi:hypothetical protein
MHKRLRTATAASPGGHGRRARSRGQTLVEFGLIFPIFITLLIALIEFGFAFNAFLAMSFTARSAVVVATQICGDGTCGTTVAYPTADCQILGRIESEVLEPADAANITSVDIYWTSAAGVVKDGGNAVTTWVRGGTTACNSTGGTIPYTRTANGYPQDHRCSYVGGCPTIPVSGLDGHPGPDTIGVRVAYRYPWHTPFGSIFDILPGSGDGGGDGFWMVIRAAEMRMEPTL